MGIITALGSSDYEFLGTVWMGEGIIGAFGSGLLM